MAAPDQQEPRNDADDDQELGYVHTSAEHRRGARTEADTSPPGDVRRRRIGNWVWVTFRGFDETSGVRVGGWLNIESGLTLTWDPGQAVTLVERIGSPSDSDGRRVVERPETILGTES